MSDEIPKKIISAPPPPTDEIDSDWGSKGADESGKTATQAAAEGKSPGSDAGAPGANAQLKKELAGQAETAAAPGTHPPTSNDEDEDEDDDDDDDDDGEDEDDDESDEDEDEEDEESAHRVSGAHHAPVTTGSRPAATDDWLPDWAPYLILALLVTGGLAGGLGAFSTPRAEASAPSTEASAPAVPTSVAASHFLVQYKGAMRAPETITRTKEEAKKRAEEGLAKARKGADFAKLVAEYSDEPGAAARGGALGEFQANQMVKPFSDAAFKLKVGEISSLVETDFGFHVIKRTK
jgi:parvulin-like peptidyl-prolyl isomerase